MTPAAVDVVLDNLRGLAHVSDEIVPALLASCRNCRIRRRFRAGHDMMFVESNHVVYQISGVYFLVFHRVHF